MEPLAPGDPRQAGPYLLLGRLGGGGMGVVFLAESPGGRRVAVKVMRPGLAAEGDFRLRFAREVQAARRVGGFHTAPVVDADPDADPPWMATGYIAGPSLQEMVRDRGPLAPEAACALGAALAEGLAAIHACGLVHRDLKPANVIMAADGPRIIDFGIVAAAGAAPLTTPGTLLGTYAFMSPEQVRGQDVTPASDVFSLGCVLAFAATGRIPFEGESVPALVYQILAGRPGLAGLAAGPLREVITGCLDREPASRPAPGEVTARLAAARLQAVLSAAQTIPPGQPVPPGQLPLAAPAPGSALLPREQPLPAAGGQEVAAGEGSAGQAWDEVISLSSPAGPGQRPGNITITQVASAAPGANVIQVAGNATLGDDAGREC